MLSKYYILERDAKRLILEKFQGYEFSKLWIYQQSSIVNLMVIGLLSKVSIFFLDPPKKIDGQNSIKA